VHGPTHPVRLVVGDDYRRSRVTVFFRLLLAIPHLIWFFLWSLLIVVAAVINWLISIFTGRPPGGIHRLMCAYVRYQAHLGAYITLVADPYPAFLGEPGSYPVDVELPEEPLAQRRWTIGIRLVLAVPALLVSAALGGVSGGNIGSSRGQSRYSTGGGALLLACAFLGWFASLARGRMPKGLRDAGAYSLGYTAQLTSYLLLVTERYPNADPTEMLLSVADRPPLHPVRVVGDPDDLRRSRLTVAFRLLLALPHLVWLVLWGILVFFAAIGQWFVTLVRGTPTRGLHRFISAYVRYRLHVLAFLLLAANPFPGFTGTPGLYPLDLEVAGPERQNRWKTGFRLVLVIPAIIVNSALGGALFTTAVLTWFYALIRGSAPWGLRNLAVYALRYDAQTNSYLLLVTDTYPHASPLEGAAAVTAEVPVPVQA
jgi:Domain of unknown function (DUF4389)